MSPVAAVKMHDEELEIDVALVRRLLAEQFPEWADLPLEPVVPRGTDNAIFRLGDDMAVRLPRIHWAVGQAEHEQEWLPRLAPHLPLRIPRALAVGEPGEGYPHSWAVHTWLPGEPATADRLGDLREAAADLARFVLALRGVDTTGAPPAARGGPLTRRDEQTRGAIAKLRGTIDTAAASAAWEAALAAPAWDGPSLWTHGDLDSRNLLAHEGRLSGLVDFGALGVGDPACDVTPAWKMFSGMSREAFGKELAVDDATWARARGWVLTQCVMALSYYTLENNRVLVLEARRWLAEVLADQALDD